MSKAAPTSIGIAIGFGADVAKETGGIVLVKTDARDVVLGIRLSRATMRKIKQHYKRRTDSIL